MRRFAWIFALCAMGCRLETAGLDPGGALEDAALDDGDSFEGDGNVDAPKDSTEPIDTAPADTSEPTDTTAIDTGGDDAAADSIVVDTATPDTETDTGTTDTGPVDTGTCPEPGGKVHAGHCYFPDLTLRPWAAARDFCISKGAHLVTIANVDEQNAVASLAPAFDRWIGARQVGGGSSPFNWVTGGSLGYTNWDIGEPNGTGSCVRMASVTHKWRDTDCNGWYASICERD